jgi:hypothetical protein
MGQSIAMRAPCRRAFICDAVKGNGALRRSACERCLAWRRNSEDATRPHHHRTPGWRLSPPYASALDSFSAFRALRTTVSPRVHQREARVEFGAQVFTVGGFEPVDGAVEQL